MLKGSKFAYKGKEIDISTDFDNGGLARIEERETNLFDCWPYEESEYRDGFICLKPLNETSGRSFDGANFCFHFRLKGCKDKKVKFRFYLKEREKEGDTSVVYANPDFPVYSYDGNNWERMKNKSLTDDSTKENWKIVSVEQIFVKDKVYIAYQYPYTNNHLDNYIKKIQDSPFCKIEVAGCSTEGRDIKQINITDVKIPLKEKKVAWFTGLQHCAELGAGWGLEGIIDFLLSDDIMAKEAREKYLFKIIPVVNIDAVAEGRGRAHNSGKNLNREWEKPDPVPDVASIKKTLDEWKAKGNSIDIFIDFHGFSSRDGRWSLVVLPEGTYKNNQAVEYKKLIGVLRRYIPSTDVGPNPSVGFAAGAGCRQYEALSLSIDGYVYKWPVKGKALDLSSYYRLGSKIWDLKDIKAAGANFVKSLVEFCEE